MVTSDIVVCGFGVTESGTGPLGPFRLISGSALSQLVADAPGQPATPEPPPPPRLLRPPRDPTAS
jgi:hypothetical protein